MNADLSLISSWGRNNDLKFGLKKCKVTWFQNKRDRQNFPEIRMEGEVLEQVQEFKYLGLILDEGLTLKAHIEIVCSKAQRRLFMLTKASWYFRSSVVVGFYQGFIRTMMEWNMARLSMVLEPADPSWASWTVFRRGL